MYRSRNPHNRSNKRRTLAIILALIVTGVVLALWLGNRSADAPDPSITNDQSLQQLSPEEPVYEAIDLQPIVDAWDAKQAATYGIVVYDQRAKKTIANVNADESFFAASLYKIYVAYLALLDIQNGTIDPDETLSQGFSWKECIDKMIRESHSPCGEAAMAEMGQTTLNSRVKAMGITGTTFNGITTSAADSVRILQYILDKRDLNDENTAYLRDAMGEQEAKFKRGLATGAPEATWETKVGWNETYNYHDIGIMTMPDGRVFAVAILGEGQGSSAPIADFAKTVYAALAL